MLLGIPDAAAPALYNKQLVQDKQTIHDMDDSEIDTICHVLCRPCGNAPGHAIAEISVTRLTLLCFWIRRHERIYCAIGSLRRPFTISFSCRSKSRGSSTRVLPCISFPEGKFFLPSSPNWNKNKQTSNKERDNFLQCTSTDQLHLPIIEWQSIVLFDYINVNCH